MEPVDGVLVIDKPQDLTSHDVVARARRVLGTKRVGHLGTLDPMATGVLPLVVGRATRLASLLSIGPKVYEAVIRLGVVTDTYDVTGSVVSNPANRGVDPRDVDLRAVETARQAFIGTFHQRPPAFSAKKIRGIRAYRLARRQRAVEPSATEVTVHSFEIRSLVGDRLSCRISCSPGFYMRSLANDLGQTLGCGGCLETLRRERSGTFGSDSAIGLDVIERDGRQAQRRLVPLAQLLPELPCVVVTERGSRLVSHGNALGPAHIDGGTGQRPSRTSAPDRADGRRLKVYDQGGTLLAIAEMDASNTLHPRIVLV